VSQVTLARNRSLGRLESSTARLPRGQQNWSGLRFFLSSSWCLPPSYGCGGCRILRARTVGQYVESAGLEKTTAAPSAMKGVRNDRRALMIFLGPFYPFLRAFRGRTGASLVHLR
jgi:hypothetical protein